MSIRCPRCRTSIGPEAERCPECGLTSTQVDQLLSVAALAGSGRQEAAPTSTRPATMGPGAGAGTDVSPGGDKPVYWSEPVYGRGPTHRGVGYSPAPPRVSDLRRADTTVDLTGDEPRVLVPGTHASPKAPPAPAAPRLRQSASTTRTNRAAELLLLAMVAGMIALTIVLFTITSR